MIKSLPNCFIRALINTIKHDGVEHAGYLAFLGLLSLFPFLVFVFAVAGVLGQGETGAEFITTVLQAVPRDVTAALQPRIIEIISGPPQGLLTISILGTIWTASSALEGLRTILNRAYHVTTPPAYLLRRLMSVIELLTFASIMIGGMLLMVFIPLALRHLENILGIYFISEHETAWSKIVLAASIAMVFFAVCGIYYMLPNIKQRFISVAPGALIVVVLWMIAAYLFTLYLSHFEQVNLVYGSLGGIIVALIFFYICNMIFIYGAEFNYQIVQLVGMRVTEREKGGVKPS